MTTAPPTRLSRRILELEPKIGKLRDYGGNGFTPADVEAIYEQRRRGVTWRQINEVLDYPYARHQTCGEAVHKAARSFGIEPYYGGTQDFRNNEKSE